MNEALFRHYLIGTAGHVDHGKTALIRALTGVDTDRLHEERERGISIVLGFAPYEPRTGTDAVVGVIDVPGHERFIKTMVAGATGIDLALLVVAADEGVKPQTREHLEILTLLGVRDGIIVLTKTDLVDDPEWLELVAEEVRELVAPTFLAEAPIVPVSVVSGAGLDELRAAIDTELARLPERPPAGEFRMPIDRAFTIKGIGTVVTGSVWSGSVGVGEAVELQPAGTRTRVRELQQYGHDVERTVPATRTAVALHGVSVEEAAPGNWLVSPDSVPPTRTVDLHLRHLPSASAPIRHNQRVRVHHGTRETFGRLRLLDAEELAPGAEGFAQLRLEEPLVAAVGDRLLIRRYSPMRTIAGAVMLDVDPPRHRRRESSVVEGLELRLRGDPLQAVGILVAEAGLTGVGIEEVERRSGRTRRELVGQGEARGWRVVGDRLVSDRRLAVAVERLVPLLEGLHAEHPMRRGLSAEAIAAALEVPANSPQLEHILEQARRAGLVEADPPFWRRAGFAVRFEGAWGRAAEALEAAARARGLLPWDAAETEAAVKAALDGAGLPVKAGTELLEAMLGAGRLVRYPSGFTVGGQAHTELLDRIRVYLRTHGSLTVGDFRDLSGGLTRKYAIPILEFLDDGDVTRREGDVRVPGPALGL
jgi:selenocysteine-specific elongation factor